MAFTNLPAAKLSFGVVDASGSKSSIECWVPFATAIADVIAGADILRPLVQALTDAVIVTQSVTFSYADNAPGTPVAGSRIEEKGVFVWRTANGRTTRFSIPAIKDTLLKASGAVDRSNLAVAAMITAVTDVDALWCAADGNDITALAKAYQRFNSSTRNQLPTDV